MPVTNAIESLNSVIRRAIKKRKGLPTDDSVKKKVNNATEGLAYGNELLYYRVR